MAFGNNRSDTSRSRAGRSGERDNRKVERARKNELHTKDMEDAYAKDIERSFAGLRAVDGSPKVEAEGCVPSVAVIDQDAVTAILENGRGRAQFCDMAVLDFASFTSPGGGYIRGSVAQEESLCMESYLYNVLKRKEDWYVENRRRNINCNLYKNRALVVPAVRFGRDRVHAYADVLVVAAPNARRAREEYNVDKEALERAMRERIRFALSLADELGHEKLVLGAFGCGVFGWDASVVAEMLREELSLGAHVAKQVVFAVPKGRFDENLPKFAHAFAMFPDKNPQAYATPVVEVKPVVEEYEDDWRKYL